MAFIPRLPLSWEETGLNRTLLLEMILRTIYTKSRATGNELAEYLKLFYGMISPLLTELRASEYIDIAGQRGVGDTNYEYVLTTRGTSGGDGSAAKNAICRTMSRTVDDVYRSHEMADDQERCRHATLDSTGVQRPDHQRASIERVGPAVNSASSIFLFGYAGNGKTSIAERITRLMGDAIYIPYAIEADGQLIKVFDPIVHTAVLDGSATMGSTMPSYDTRWVKIKRPVVIVGGELVLSMLDLTYNETAKFYEAPFQMKANGGIFLIDDFGRQQCRPIDLLNRWIVPLEKRYDYLTTVTGKKLEIPFDQLIIFSSNLDPQDLADEAFLRRIKYKINVRDPDEAQWRQIWQLVCKSRKIFYDEKGIDYLLEKWYKPYDRPLRMCQPRDLLDQMISMAKYSMEQVTLANPDLVDAAAGTYFISGPRQSFGAKTNL